MEIEVKVELAPKALLQSMILGVLKWILSTNFLEILKLALVVLGKTGSNTERRMHRVMDMWHGAVISPSAYT